MIVGQGPIALAVGAGGGGLDIFTLLYPFSPLSPALWETARYRLKYCLKGPLNHNNPIKSIHLLGGRVIQWCWVYLQCRSVLLIWISWLVVLSLTALRDSISVYIGPSPKEREKEESKDRRE